MLPHLTALFRCLAFTLTDCPLYRAFYGRGKEEEDSATIAVKLQNQRICQGGVTFIFYLPASMP